MEYQIRQTMEIDKLSEKTATDKIRKEDKVRSVYYNFYTGHDWENRQITITVSIRWKTVRQSRIFITSNGA